MGNDNFDTLNRRAFLCNSSRGVALSGGGLLLAQAMPSQPSFARNAHPGFQVGWATVSITPDQPVQLAGQFHERVSTQETLYPCVATALAIEGVDDSGASSQAILLACDLVNVGAEFVEEIRSLAAAQLPDFDGVNLILNATHTHTGPTLTPGVYKEPDPGVMGPVEYAPFFCERAAEAVIQAWRARRPSAASHALGHAAVGFNRIAVYADGSSRMYGNSGQTDFIGLEGGHDHGLELVFLWDDSDTLSGVMINLACPAQVVEGQNYLSADFWGPVREEIKRLYGENVSVYPMIGPAGDQSPRDLVRRGRGEPDMRSEPGMREMARRIVNGVQDAFANFQSEPNPSPIFRHYTEQIELPTRPVSDAEAEEARREYERLSSSNDLRPGSPDAAFLRRARDVVTRYDNPQPTYSMELHTLRLGDIAIATNPFELYLEYGERMKGRSPAHQTLLVQLANDRGRYLPTRRAVAGGAYGSRIEDTIVGPEGGDELVSKTLDALNRLWQS